MDHLHSFHPPLNPPPLATASLLSATMRSGFLFLDPTYKRCHSICPSLNYFTYHNASRSSYCKWQNFLLYYSWVIFHCIYKCRRSLFDSWIGKIPWRRDRLPTLVFLGSPGLSVSIPRFSLFVHSLEDTEAVSTSCLL